MRLLLSSLRFKSIVATVAVYVISVITASAAIFNVAGFFKTSSLGDFSITGVTGSTDVINDAFLAPDTAPTINFSASSGATAYDVLIKDATDTTTLCSESNVTGTSVSFFACSLSHGLTYRVHVTAKKGGLTKLATNDATYSFVVDTVVPTVNTITGITNGGTDTTLDAWLVGGNVPRVNWNAFTNAGSYDVEIRDSGGSSVVCATQNTTSTNYTFTGCTLNNGTVYRAYVTAKSTLGGNQTPASNTAYSFTVDSTAPGAFSISGITGGADSTVDNQLTSGSSPTVNYGSSSNAVSYDILIKDATGTTTICSLLGDSASPAPVAGCGLVDGTSYKAYVTAKSASGLMTQIASNEPYSFTVVLATYPPSDFMLTGATGGSDLSADNWLTDGTTVTANWQTSYGATGYNVLIRNAADSADVCSQQTTTATSYTFTGCTLTVGTQYRIKVTATGSSSVAALNNGFLFQVVSGGPGSFGITGITGSGDSVADQYLAGSSTTPTVNFTTSPNAIDYNVTVRNSTDTADVCVATMVPASPYIFSGCNLTRGSSYKLKVAANNGSATSDAYNNGYSFYVANTTTFCPTGSSTAKALIIYDSGGLGADYAKSENCNFTASPPATASSIVLSFTGFASNDGGDVLTVYDGTNTSGTNLGAHSNTTIAPANKTATSGNMHFTWVSNNSPTMAGYNMTYRATYLAPGAFSISGITGGTDSTADALLTNGVNATVNWSAASNASSYDVTIFDATGVNVVCAKVNTATTSYAFSSCTLTSGMSYTVQVYAINGNDDYMSASNNIYLFTVGLLPGAFSITGATGGVDTLADQYLEDGINPKVSWSASGGATSYDVTIYEVDGNTLKCATVNVSAPTTFYNFSSCNLSDGSTYRIKVLAKNASGNILPSNNMLSFYVGALWYQLNNVSGRFYHTEVWTGSEMIVWGGFDGSSYLNSGGKYNPSTDSWSATSIGVNVPSARTLHVSIWTGTEMIVWGGGLDNGTTFFNSGGRYDPATNSWLAMSLTGAPDGRQFSTAIWTGSEMIIWGGSNSAGRLNSGGKYNPSTDTWSST